MRYQRVLYLQIRYISYFNLFQRETFPNFNLKFKELVSTGPVGEEEVGYLLFTII